jgi:hypothetical protein
MHNFGWSDLFEGSINERFMCMQPYLAHYRAPAKCNIGKSDRETDAAETLKLRASKMSDLDRFDYKPNTISFFLYSV